MNGPSTLLLVALLLSGVGLLAGPAILSLGRGRATAGALVEGLALGLLPTMVLLRLLPHVAESLGGWALALFAAAFLALRAFDRAHHRAAARVGRAFIYSALALHSFTDGVGLAAAIAATPSHGAVDLTLAVAFVIHRLPEGLFIATTLLPTYGMRRTLLRTLGLFAATVAGGLLGGALLPLLSERLFDGVVALGLGAMLQLVLHSHADDPTQPMTRGIASAALLAGVVVTLLVPTPHDLLTLARPNELPVARSIGPLFVWTAPVLLLAIAGSALLRTFGRIATPRRGVLDGLRFGAEAPVGPAYGIATARGLVRTGTPRRAVAAFALSVGALTLDGALVSLRLLGAWLTLARLAAATTLALIGGALFAKQAALPPAVGVHTRRAGALVLHFLRGVDELGASYCAGLLVAAGLEAAVDPRWITTVGFVPSLIALPLLAFATGASPLFLAPVAAVLLHKGVGGGPVLALLLAGPIGGRSRYALLSSSRLAPLAAFAAVLALALGGSALVPVTAPAMHTWVERAPSPVELASAVAVGLLLVASLLRLGPRLFIEQLLVDRPAAAPHDHSHDRPRPARHDEHGAHEHVS